jgi:hypothetical protein
MNQTSKDIARPGAEPRILVVEDESDLALLLAYNLEAEGYNVESVGRATRPSFIWPRTSRTWSSSTGCCRAFPALGSAGG